LGEWFYGGAMNFFVLRESCEIFIQIFPEIFSTKSGKTFFHKSAKWFQENLFKRFQQNLRKRFFKNLLNLFQQNPVEHFPGKDRLGNSPAQSHAFLWKPRAGPPVCIAVMREGNGNPTRVLLIGK
jgi:hypothetical protein